MTSPTNPVDQIADREAFIAAMSSVAASVGVVTTDGAAGRHGATVTAFASVSADPPTVLVCLHAKSRIAQMTRENATFCLNILPKSGQNIADRFAGKDDATLQDRFDGIAHSTEAGQSPSIDGATYFACKVENAILSGSHLIVTGLVQRAHAGSADPLTYRDRAYHQVVPVKD